MINPGTTLNVVDNTGILKARCIKVYGDTKKNYARIGDIILVVVVTYTLKRGFLLDKKKKERFLKGKKHRALVIRIKQNYKRNYGVFIKFSDNAIIIINKRKTPLSKKINGPVLYELLEKYPSIGILARWLI
jgi:large subunit ribosomal protein L14